MWNGGDGGMGGWGNMGMGVNGVWVGGGIPGGIFKEGIRRYELPKSQDISIRLRCTGWFSRSIPFSR